MEFAVSWECSSRFSAKGHGRGDGCLKEKRVNSHFFDQAYIARPGDGQQIDL
jgi:hypothetical protein